MSDTLQPPAGGDHGSAVPGSRLSEARQSQNLAAVDIARQLKLSVWQIEALEAGRYDKLPGPIFVRGFIRNYARIVKLDPEELLRAAGDSLPQQSARPETPPSHDIPFPTTQPARWPRYVAAAAVIFGLLAIYEFFWSEPDGAAPRTVAVTRVPVTPAPPRANSASTAQAANEPRAAQPAVAAAETVTAEAAPPATGRTEGSAEAASAERQPKRGEKVVRLEFDQESWVEIRDRNERIVFSQLNRPGTSQQVSGLPPLSVVVGNAHGVRMTFSDQPVDLAIHTKIDVARLILE